MAQEVKHIVHYVPVNQIEELEDNPRTISREDFERLKTSIKANPDYFEARPLILSDRTGKLVVIAGNQRLRAAKALGQDQVPAVVLSGLTKEREQEIVIRDNVSNGRWDMDLLANNYDIGDLADWGVNVDIKAEIEEGVKKTDISEDEIKQIVRSYGEIQLEEFNDVVVFTVKLPMEDYAITQKAVRQFDKNIGLSILPEESEAFQNGTD